MIKSGSFFLLKKEGGSDTFLINFFRVIIFTFRNIFTVKIVSYVLNIFLFFLFLQIYLEEKHSK